MLAHRAAPSTHPASQAFDRVERRLVFDDAEPARLNPHTLAVVDRLCRWAARHGLASDDRVRRALERAQFNVLAGYGHPDAGEEGFFLTLRWCTWLFFQDDMLCDRKPEDGGVLGPAALAEAHVGLLAALRGDRPPRGDGLATSIHEIGREIVARGGQAALDRFVGVVEDYFWGNEWEALNRVRGEVPSVSAFVKMRLHAGAAYTAFEFWEIAEPFENPSRDHVAARELRAMANNCISWANDLYSLRKEIHEGNPNNLALALAAEEGRGVEAAMDALVERYNLEYAAFRRLWADLTALGVPGLDGYARRLHQWTLGNIRWSRRTLRYREELSMKA